MVKYYGIVLSFLGFFSVNLRAQQTTLHRCGYDLVVEQTAAQYPHYREAIQQTFEQAKRLGAAEQQARNVYSIPVVVHVVWNDPVEHLPLSQIQEQIAILNADYRRLNADAQLTRAEFLPIVGDAQIEFNLVHVEYVETQATFTFDANYLDEVKATATGGSDPWDTRYYLNIWICNIPTIFGSPLLGYAYPPAGLPNWPAGVSAPSADVEGVVIDYRTIGANRTYPIPAQNINVAIEGRTATHEVGHYLGLRHLWGDGNPFITDCSVDDGVADTPNSGSNSQFNCDATKNTCVDTVGGVDLPDMFENFMDYSEEFCQNAFTEGQIAIMRGVLAPGGARRELIDGPVANSSVLADWSARVYPNPSRGTFTLSFGEASLQEGRWQLLDALGRVHLAQSWEPGTSILSIQAEGLAPGLYFLRLQEGQRQTVRSIQIL